MPVRIKQRAMISQSGKDDEKQFTMLKRHITGLLLAWHIPVSLTLRSPDSGKKLSIRGRHSPANSDEITHPSASGLDVFSVCSVLSQAGYLGPSDRNTWVKASARTPFITIRAAISLQPAPSKQAQYISIGPRPINSAAGSNVLFDEVNRLFASSSFGSQDDLTTEEASMWKRDKDRPYKRDGFTIKQLKGGGKRVDRWPMFYIRIELQRTSQAYCNNFDRLGEDTLASILKVLRAMTTSFLQENHFRPKARPILRRREVSKNPKAVGISRGLQISGEEHLIPNLNNERQPNHIFQSWSRIKSGTSVKPSLEAPPTGSYGRAAGLTKGTVIGFAEPTSKPIAAPQNMNTCSTEVADSAPNHDEKAIEWINPITGATVRINVRTGLVIDSGLPKRPASAPSNILPSTHGADIQQGARLSRRFTRSISTPFVPPKPGSWASDFLKKWENPIFNMTEEGIPQVSLDGPSIEASGVLHGRRPCCSELDIQKAFAQSSTTFSAKLSKSALRDAKIMAQVDKKFILVHMRNSTKADSLDVAQLLVLIDQHAADERIRVEGLLADLKSTPTLLAKPIVFEIQGREHGLLSRLATHFETWGISYSLSTSSASPECRLFVKALPAVIAERCRVEPKVLIELIRSEAWKIGGDGGLFCPNTCPQGLLDMLNSRACRSAIMFNDELTLAECHTLVQKLGDCAFPFQCAHGRPSMVPLVDMGPGSSIVNEERAFGAGKRKLHEDDEEKSFGVAWKVWKHDYQGVH